MQDRAQIERVGDFLIIRTGSGEDQILRAIRASQVTGMVQSCKRRMLTGPDLPSSRPSVLLHLLGGEDMWLPGWTMEELVFFLSIRGPEQGSSRARKEEEAGAVVTEALRADGLLSDKTVSLRVLGKKEVLQSLVAACHYQLGVVHLELTEPVPAHEFSWETAQRGERRQGKLDSIFSVLHAAEQVLRELG